MSQFVFIRCPAFVVLINDVNSCFGNERSDFPKPSTKLFWSESEFSEFENFQNKS